MLNRAVELTSDRGYKLTFSALASGQDYQFQVWASNSGANLTTPFRFDTTVSDVFSNSVSLNPGDNGGGGLTVPSQYAIGTFTADAAGQEVFLSSSEVSGFTNGFQLRRVAPSVAPEPGTALFGLPLLGTAGFFRRRSAAQ